VSWRDSCAPIIRRVLAETTGSDEKAIKAALFAAYPYGQRRHHPYKIWLDEIQRQRKLKPPLGTFGPRAKERAAPDPRQDNFFFEEASDGTALRK